MCVCVCVRVSVSDLAIVITSKNVNLFGATAITQTISTCVITGGHLLRVALLVDSGTLLTRSLADVVSKQDFVVDSKNLITVLVVVPRQVCYLCSVMCLLHC